MTYMYLKAIGMDMPVMRALTLCVVASLVSGCSFVKAVTFRSDKYSFKREGGTTQLELYGRSNPDRCVDGPPRWPELPPSPGPQVAPLFIPIAGALVGVAVNVGLSEMKAYVASKKAEFAYSYRGIVNRPLFYSRGEPWDWAIERAATRGTAPDVAPYSLLDFNCLRITRKFVMTDDKGAKTEAPGFVWVGALTPNASGTALKIQTKDIDLAQSGARTGTEGKVDVTVEVKIDAVIVNAKRESVFTTVADKILAFPAMRVHGEKELDKDDAKHLEELRKTQSSWFPLIPKNEAEIARCNSLPAPPAPRPGPDPTQPGEVLGACGGVTAVTVAVLVTETGSGSDAFGDLAKEIDDNKKTLQDAFTKGVTDALTPKDGGK